MGDHLKIKMKFIILASLFVLSVVAEPEAQHFTAGFVQHVNGAVVPQDTDSVKVAKVQHLAAKNTAYLTQGKPFYGHFPVHVKTPVTYKVQTPVTYKVQTPAHTYPINPFYHVYQPHVYTHHVPVVHKLGKREAEAEPEADAQYYNYYGYSPYTTGYQTYGYTGYPYNTGYTYSPYFNNFYNRRVFKREAEAEPEAEADAQYYYNTGFYGNYQSGFRYPYTSYARTPYTYNTYSPYNYNTFNGYYRY